MYIHHNIAEEFNHCTNCIALFQLFDRHYSANTVADSLNQLQLYLQNILRDV